MREFLIALTLLASVGTARADALDDCVLRTMPGTTSDAAARAIKESCLRKSSVQLDDVALRGLRIVTGSYGPYGYRNTPGFMAEVKNDSGFVVTELTFAVSVAGGTPEQFTVDRFYYDDGTLAAGPMPDLTVIMRIDPGKSRKFHFEADRPEIDKKKKWSWQLVAAKGFASR